MTIALIIETLDRCVAELTQVDGNPHAFKAEELARLARQQVRTFSTEIVASLTVMQNSLDRLR